MANPWTLEASRPMDAGLAALYDGGLDDRTAVSGATALVFGTVQLLPAADAGQHHVPADELPHLARALRARPRTDPAVDFEYQLLIAGLQAQAPPGMPQTRQKV